VFQKPVKPPPLTARSPSPSRPPVAVVSPIDAIEPGRRRRLHRDRDEHGDWLDLHGMTQDQARAALTGFVLRASAQRQRHVLVITGKGNLGDGVLRRRVPEWLAEPPLRKLVAGLSEAHRRHGGEGALHVALKRAEPI
jgi:DNA-nicking Smr family endonuclease